MFSVGGSNSQPTTSLALLARLKLFYEIGYPGRNLNHAEKTGNLLSCCYPRIGLARLALPDSNIDLRRL
jgi:hypothetical protein